MIQVETRPGLLLRDFEVERGPRLWRNATRDVWQVIKEDRYMGERTYIVDFRNVFELVGAAADKLYFYPHELEGFIESCVMATQREVDITSRDIQIFRELNCAMADWIRKEEEASYYSSGSLDRNYSVEEAEINDAMKIAAHIDDLVHATMSLIRDVHGDYAIDERSLKWTKLHALKMRLRF
jgi:hypothetical protein